MYTINIENSETAVLILSAIGRMHFDNNNEFTTDNPGRLPVNPAIPKIQVETERIYSELLDSLRGRGVLAPYSYGSDRDLQFKYDLTLDIANCKDKQKCLAVKNTNAGWYRSSKF